MKSRLALILFVSTLIFAGNQVGAQIQVTQSAGAKLTNQGSTTVDFVLDPRDNPNEQHKLYSISEQATGTYVAAASGSYICDVPAQLVLDPGPYTFAMGSLGGNSFDVLANGGEQTWQLYYGKPDVAVLEGATGAGLLTAGLCCMGVAFALNNPNLGPTWGWTGLALTVAGTVAALLSIPNFPAAKLVSQTR